MRYTNRHLIVLLANIGLGTCSFANTFQGKVVGVTDGDTITFVDTSNRQYKVRLAAIDAPEKAQAFGSHSRENLSNLVFGKFVTVDWAKKDRWGRVVGKVLVAEQDANLLQLRAGLAWHYKAYASEQTEVDRADYARAELSARTRRAGIWSTNNPVPPWEYRHRGSRAFVKIAPSL